MPNLPRPDESLLQRQLREIRQLLDGQQPEEERVLSQPESRKH